MKKKLLLTFAVACLLAGTAFSAPPSDKDPMDAQAAVLKAVQLDTRIKEKKSALEREKAKAFKKYEDESKAENDKLGKLKKDEFETTAEFNAKIDAQRIKLSNELREKKENYVEKVYNAERDKSIVNLEKELEDLLARSYPVPNEYFKIAIGKFNADGNYFDVEFSYYVRTDVNRGTGKKNYVWDKVPLKWEIERDKAKEVSNYKSTLVLACRASVFRLADGFVTDKYEISIVDPKTNEPLFASVFFKNRQFNVASMLLDFGSKTYAPTIPDLRLRAAEKTGGVLRMLKKDEKLRVLAIGSEETIEGNKGHWVKVKSLVKSDQGWCFSYYLTVLPE